MQVEHVSIWPPIPPSPQTLGGSGSTLSKFNPVSSNAQENTHKHKNTQTHTHTTNENIHIHFTLLKINPTLLAPYNIQYTYQNI